MDTEVIGVWLKKVRSDLNSAFDCTEGPHFEPENAAYHCQQAAEKLVKAVLVAHGIYPPKIHNIAKLLALRPPGLPIADRLAPLIDFTPYDTAPRYPGEPGGAAPPIPTRTELLGWIEDIGRVRGLVVAT